MNDQPKDFPPRGYVQREGWLRAYDKCDPGDGFREVLCHFIPHREYQLPALFAVLSVDEHDHEMLRQRDRLLANRDADVSQRDAKITELEQKVKDLEAKLAGALSVIADEDGAMPDYLRKIKEGYVINDIRKPKRLYRTDRQSTYNEGFLNGFDACFSEVCALNKIKAEAARSRAAQSTKTEGEE